MSEDKQPLTPGQRWKDELQRAREHLAPWHKSARAILQRLKDQRGDNDEGRRVNLFTAGFLTQRAVLYGKTPTASVTRRWKDAADDTARVAAEMLSRHLNDDISSGADGYERALGYVLENRLTVGMGLARVRYEAKTEPAPVDPMQPPQPEGAPPAMVKVPGSERVPTDYVYWEDVLWSPCRYWEVVRWVAFKAEMSRKALVRRFGEAKGGTVPLDATKPKDGDKDKQHEPPWGRATVWEVWDKEEREVVWVTEAGLVLDTRKDPYQLRGFFPCPRPLFSLITTDEMIPRPDFAIAEDLYRDLDTLATRMGLLREALRVVGMYDASNTELAELLTGTADNRMVPVKNWALFGEKGGLAGAVDFFPVDKVAATLVALGAEYEALKARLYEVTGMSDILRGQSSASQTTATEQRVKAQFGSARLQAVQDEFARFATELQALKAEVVANLFEPEEIVRASNMERTPDADLAMAAAQLLKSSADAFRVKVQPEALALSDFAALKEERLEVVAAVGQFVNAVTPMLGMMPGAAPALLEILKWLVASLRGSSEIEGVLDKAMEMAQQAASQPQQGQPQQPDPKLLATQMKVQGDLAKADKEHANRLQEISAEVAADEQREANQMHYNVMEDQAKQRLRTMTRPAQPQSVPGNGPRGQ